MPNRREHTALARFILYIYRKERSTQRVLRSYFLFQFPKNAYSFSKSATPCLQMGQI